MLDKMIEKKYKKFEDEVRDSLNKKALESIENKTQEVKENLVSNNEDV